jgi:hypothetical protein
MTGRGRKGRGEDEFVRRRNLLCHCSHVGCGLVRPLERLGRLVRHSALQPAAGGMRRQRGIVSAFLSDNGVETASVLQQAKAYLSLAAICFSSSSTMAG